MSITSGVSTISGLASELAPGSISRVSSSQASASQHVSFEDVFGTIAREAVDIVKSGEGAAVSGIQGKASVQHVVDAVMASERSLHTLIAFRDKAVSAYQEITRMSI